MRRAPLAFAATLVALLVVLGVVLLRAPGDVASPSPSPTGTAAASPSATASPSPSPTPKSAYMSKPLGFALELPSPWHKSLCGNASADDFADGEAREVFTTRDPMNELVNTGGALELILVGHAPIPQGQTVRQLAAFSHPTASIKDVTFAGRSAVEVSESAPGPPSRELLFYFIPDSDRYYRVGYQMSWPASAAPPDIATMQRIVRSFRSLAAAERQALPDPTPIPAAAPTPQALAALLKTALEGKDVTALERLVGPCVSVGALRGEVSLLTRQRYVAHLRAQFTAGLTVTVDASAIKTEAGFYGTTVRSRWNAVPAGEGATPSSPGTQVCEVDLVLGKTRDGYFWRGTLRTQAC